MRGSSAGRSATGRPACARVSGRRVVVTRAAQPESFVGEKVDKQRTIKLFSPSKINLFLRVMRRREDGYHDLASLFHVIDLGDHMEFTPSPYALKDTLECSDRSIPSDESNLVIKALNLYRRKTLQSMYFHVKLVKRVPHGAGLGGGSGNAATTLYAANKLLGGIASNEELLEWAGEIGSDISVFFSNGAAYCTGRGEVVEDVAPPVPLDTPMLLVKPPVGLATPRIFKSLDLDRRSSADPRGLLADIAAAKGVDQAAAVNDLEQPAFDNLPELAALKKRLIESGSFRSVFMTGSGSTIVCFGSDKAPEFLGEPLYQNLFVSPARLITRKPNGWYEHSGQWAEPQ
ncbi:hypothetical protein HYH03_016051 [Edaphochlamys debaryana]|uniref:4-(cytidine 5'-diphospho)-2-C-methyl-D-erythritol kinase n=1 Tax=Edaphochlamys debaryana TaxID=47281 RepID=A0A835XJU2_9CHLO|nr:hypothetical protein HYH03_016051 [Edaphochlamys debaryana]|eukprot:KAG2485161.1 hypothetical protein HYH03_016051 [Edaphochlamys debaryana]